MQQKYWKPAQQLVDDLRNQIEKERKNAKKTAVLKEVFNEVIGILDDPHYWPQIVSFEDVVKLSIKEIKFSSKNLDFYKQAKQTLRNLGFSVRQKKKRKYLQWNVNLKKFL